MGNTASSVASPLAIGDGRPKHGYQILHIEPNSPASNARLIPYFDYIASVNGVMIVQESPNVVAEMAASNIEKPLRFVIYNAKQDSTREVTIVPSRKWGGSTLLGTSIRFSRFDDAPYRVWHVLEVHENSPAALAGLIPIDDWIIGSPDVCIYSEDDFYNLLIHNVNKAIKMIVYNIRSDSCREIAIIPNFQWGGAGCLGCDVGGGILHKIPAEGIVQSGAPTAILMDAAGPNASSNSNPSTVTSANLSAGTALTAANSHGQNSQMNPSAETLKQQPSLSSETKRPVAINSSSIKSDNDPNSVNSSSNNNIPKPRSAEHINQTMGGEGAMTAEIYPFVVTHAMAPSSTSSSNAVGIGNTENNTNDRHNNNDNNNNPARRRGEGEGETVNQESLTNPTTLYGVQDVPPFLTTHAQPPPNFYNVSREELNLLPPDDDNGSASAIGTGVTERQHYHQQQQQQQHYHNHQSRQHHQNDQERHQSGRTIDNNASSDNNSNSNSSGMHRAELLYQDNENFLFDGKEEQPTGSHMAEAFFDSIGESDKNNSPRNNVNANSNGRGSSFFA